MPQNLYIIWSEKWELGIGILDEQHRGGVSLINSLYYFMGHDEYRHLIIPLIKAVEYQTVLHTFTEEDLFAKTEWPGAQAHAELHAKMLAEARAIARKTILSKAEQPDVHIFMDFFKRWWIKHILEADPEFVAHLKKYLANHEK